MFLQHFDRLLLDTQSLPSTCVFLDTTPWHAGDWPRCLRHFVASSRVELDQASHEVHAILGLAGSPIVAAVQPVLQSQRLVGVASGRVEISGNGVSACQDAPRAVGLVMVVAEHFTLDLEHFERRSDRLLPLARGQLLTYLLVDAIAFGNSLLCGIRLGIGLGGRIVTTGMGQPCAGRRQAPSKPQNRDYRGPIHATTPDRILEPKRATLRLKL